MCAIFFRKPTSGNQISILAGCTKRRVHLTIQRFFSQLYGRKTECLKISHWLRQVIFFENWSKLAFFFHSWMTLFYSTDLCLTEAHKIRTIKFNNHLSIDQNISYLTYQSLGIVYNRDQDL